MGRVDTEADLGIVRHAIDVDSLTKYLTTKHSQHFRAPIDIKQFGFGQSNPSYQIKDGNGRKYVLRKQPHGKLVSKTAHRVDREYYMIKALHPLGVPVPQVYDLCQDKAVIGVGFYIMEFCEGRIFHEPELPGLSAKDRRECWQAAIEALVKLHQVDPREVVGQLPKDAFNIKEIKSHYPRQMNTMSKVADAQAKVKSKQDGSEVGPIPYFEEMKQWMTHKMPPQRASIVHGDYKIDNLVFHPTENRVIAMLDWELCTVGHPLADLGNLLMPYMTPDEIKRSGKLPGLGGSNFYVDATPGLPTLDDNLDQYKQLAGWDPKPYWSFAVVSSYFRLSVIVHGIKARVAVGQASSENAAKYASSVPVLAKIAYDELSRNAKSNSKL